MNDNMEAKMLAEIAIENAKFMVEREGVQRSEIEKQFISICADMPISTYRYLLRDFIRWLSDREAFEQFFSSPDDLRKIARGYFDELKAEGKAARTLNSVRSAIKRALRELARHDSSAGSLAKLDAIFNDHTKHNPFRTVTVDAFVNDAQLLTDEELETLVTESVPKVGLLVEFLFQTACRISEALSIRLEQIDPHNGECFVKLDDSKTNTSEEITPPSTDLVNEIQTVYGGSVYLFANTRGDGPEVPYRREYMYKILRAESERVIGRPISPHQLRHTSITFAANEFGLKKAQMHARHKSAATTQGMYWHADRPDAEERTQIRSKIRKRR